MFLSLLLAFGNWQCKDGKCKCREESLFPVAVMLLLPLWCRLLASLLSPRWSPDSKCSKDREQGYVPARSWGIKFSCGWACKHCLIPLAPWLLRGVLLQCKKKKKFLWLPWRSWAHHPYLALGSVLKDIREGSGSDITALWRSCCLGPRQQ